MNTNRDWLQCKTKVFWGEIAPCDHVVQIYEDDSIFLESLEGFVGNGINAGDCVVVIATGVHLKALEERLRARAVRIDILISENQYIPLDAADALSKFMVNGWPDENLFNQFVTETISQARSKKQQVRAFGEMVALLWAQGHCGATVQLEHLWNRFCEKEAFCLFCAYPKNGFTQDANASISNICRTHSKVISGYEKSTTEIFYKSVDWKQ